MTSIPTLTTKRLSLRQLRSADWDAFAALNADPRVRDWLGGRCLSRQEVWMHMETLLGQWLLRGYGAFAVEYRGQLIGRVGILHPIDAIEPELAWTLAVEAWGQGLATEAALCARDWAFTTFRWSRLISYINPANHRSRRVAEKLGAIIDGRILRSGIVHDIWLHPTHRTSVIV